MSKFEEMMQWLDREEEVLGIDVLTRATTDVEAARELLYSELGYEPTSKQLSGFMEIAGERYEKMPELGIMHETIWHPKFTYYQPVWRVKGRFASVAEVRGLLTEYWKVLH